MTLRMVFDRDDLQRVKVATSPDPMWETVLSLHHVREPEPAGRYAGGQRQVIGKAGPVMPALSMLFELVPQRGGFPDFLTPGEGILQVDAGCEAVACTPRRSLLPDLGRVFARRRVPGWVRDLARGDRDLLTRVARAMRHASELLVAPAWHEVQAVVAADRKERVGRLASDGVGGLLSGLPGAIHWDGHVLELRYPTARTVRLAGRGLTLVPARFCRGTPVTLIDEDRTPVLVYPAAVHGPVPGARVSGPVPPHLVALLGRTRAECLSAVHTVRSISQLADRLGTSIGTASKQAAVLRDAGLVRSVSGGGTVRHDLTALGADLLAGRLDD